MGDKFMFDACEVPGVSRQWRDGAGMAFFGNVRTQAYDAPPETGVRNFNFEYRITS